MNDWNPQMIHTVYCPPSWNPLFPPGRAHLSASTEVGVRIGYVGEEPGITIHHSITPSDDHVAIAEIEGDGRMGLVFVEKHEDADGELPFWWRPFIPPYGDLEILLVVDWRVAASEWLMNNLDLLLTMAKESGERPLLERALEGGLMPNEFVIGMNVTPRNRTERNAHIVRGLVRMWDNIDFERDHGLPPRPDETPGLLLPAPWKLTRTFWYHAETIRGEDR